MPLRQGLLWICAILALLTAFVTSEPTDVANEPVPKRRYAFRHTFKKPYYYNNTVPFWDTYGDVLLAPDFIRLGPSVPGHSGAIWAQTPNNFREWQIEFTFRISGNYLVGGRGIAFWYTKNRGEHGPVYGSRDNWDGLAIFFEAGDASRNRAQPLVTAYLNDGSVEFKSSDSAESRSFAGCYKMFRNTQIPVHARLSHSNNTVKLEIDANNGGERYSVCFEAREIILPTNYYFGMSALAEGETPDDHDVLSFETYELNPPEKKGRQPHPPGKMSSTTEEFVLSDEIRQRIREIANTVQQSEEKPKEDNFQHSTDFVRGMQVQILEGLDRVEKRIEVLAGSRPSHDVIPPPPGTDQGHNRDSSFDTIFHKLDRVMVTLSTLETKLTRNADAATEQQNAISHIINKLDALESQVVAQVQYVNQLHDTSRKQHAEVVNAHQSTWYYILYVVFACIFLWSVFVLYHARAERLEKKIYLRTNKTVLE